MDRCGYCGSGDMKGARKSSWDHMEDFSIQEIQERKEAGLSNKQRRTVHSINNPMICSECQRGVLEAIRACREITEKGSKK
jgi:hypothetical protein